MFELGRRAYGPDEDQPPPLLHTPQQAYRQVQQLGRAKKEHLVGLYLDAQNHLIARETISIASLHSISTNSDLPRF